MRRVLFALGCRALAQVSCEALKGIDCGLKAARVEGQGGVVGIDREEGLFEDRAAVQFGFHQVPGDAVLALPVHQCPGRRVASRIAREWSVVEVDRRPAREAQQFLGDQREVGDAEQVVEGRLAQAHGQVVAGVDDLEFPLLCPGAEAACGGDDPQHPESFPEQDFPTLDQERVRSNHVAGLSVCVFHRSCPPSVVRASAHSLGRDGPRRRTLASAALGSGKSHSLLFYWSARRCWRSPTFDTHLVCPFQGQSGRRFGLLGVWRAFEARASGARRLSGIRAREGPGRSPIPRQQPSAALIATCGAPAPAVRALRREGWSRMRARMVGPPAPPR